MIPYWHAPTYPIFGFPFQTWGTFVALGIFAATYIAYRGASRRGFPKQEIWDLAFWIMLAAFIGARLGHVFFYDWEFFRSHPSEIIKIWHGGLSSFGGFIGAAIVGIAFIKKKKYDFYRYSDLVISGLPLGWAIGRIGCFLIHDHPGTLTHFLLGVKYPDGVRHDLGLYDSINATLLALVLFMFRKSLGRYPGSVLAVVLIWYGVSRFFLDFLRAYDARYFYLTPAQYGSILFFILGSVLVGKILRR